MSSVTRKHSVFGDYTVAPKGARVDKELLGAIADHNDLWDKYSREVLGKWGSLPTEKGFQEWLKLSLKGVNNARR